MHGIIGMAKGPKVYDRQSRDLPINSVVAEVVVDDPLETGAKLRVLRSVRDDPLAAMHSRGQIDTAMLAAGREWQGHHEATQIGSIGAIDTTKEAVDGGRIPEPITDRQIKGIRKLAEADKKLGQDGCALVRDVLGGNLNITGVAHKRGMTSGRQISAIMDKFRKSLDILAKLWGYA